MDAVIEAIPLDGYRLRLRFDDGLAGEVDFSGLAPFQGVFAPFRDPSEFRRVYVEPELGTVAWPWQLDLDAFVLYLDTLRRHPEARQAAAALPVEASLHAEEAFVELLERSAAILSRISEAPWGWMPAVVALYRGLRAVLSVHPASVREETDPYGGSHQDLAALLACKREAPSGAADIRALRTLETLHDGFMNPDAAFGVIELPSLPRVCLVCLGILGGLLEHGAVPVSGGASARGRAAVAKGTAALLPMQPAPLREQRLEP